MPTVAAKTRTSQDESLEWQPYGDIDSGRLGVELRRLIRGGHLPVGTRLPSERDFARRFDLPRAAVRVSLAELEREGWIDCAHGSGRSVADVGRRLERGMVGVVTASRVAGKLDAHERVGTARSDYQATCAIGELQQSHQAALVVHPQRLLDNGVEWLASRDVLGLVIAQVKVDHYDLAPAIVEARAAGLEVVCYGSSGRVVDDRDVDNESACDRVISGHADGAAMLTRWLLDQGRQKICRLWLFPEKRDWRLARDAGYEAELRKAGIEPLPPIVSGHIVAGEKSPLQDEQAYETVIATLMGLLYPHVHGTAEPVDALMVATDRHALEAADAVTRLGLTPGQDIAIVGYDNDYASLLPSYPRSVAPSATIDKNNDRIGQELVRLLLDRLSGKLAPEPQVREVAPSLVLPDADPASPLPTPSSIDEGA
ncbi:MAG: GntR family transcriptional regulator [Planctomycetota bacterium]